MAGVNTLWMLAQVVLPAGTIPQITDFDLDPGVQEILVGGSGSLDNEFGASLQVRPQVSFTTTALKSALGIAGVSGYAFVGTGSLYFRKLTAGGVRDDTACVKLTFGAGLVVPKTISVSDDSRQPAQITYDLYIISTDGTTAPITTATGQSLPTAVIAAEAFSVGPIKLNGSLISSIHSINVDFGLKPEHVHSDGFAYPTWCGIVNREPKIRCSGYDMSALDGLGSSGLALNSGLAVTAWIAYLRQIKTGSTRWSDASSKHIKLIGTTGHFKHDRHSGSSGKMMSGDYLLSPLADGTNAIVTASTDQAIT